MGYVPGKFDWKKANALNGYSGVQEAMGDFDQKLRDTMEGKSSAESKKTNIIFRLLEPRMLDVAQTNYSLGKWQVFVDSTIASLYNQLESYTTAKISNLVLMGHGTQGKNRVQLAYGKLRDEETEPSFSYPDFLTYYNNPTNNTNNEFDTLDPQKHTQLHYFQKAINQLKPKGSLIICACEAGDDKNKAEKLGEYIYKIKNDVKHDISIYLNRDPSTGSQITWDNTKIVISGSDGKIKPITAPEDFSQGWFRYNSKGLIQMGSISLVESIDNPLAIIEYPTPGK